MGQSKGGGYTKKDTLLPEQLQTLLSQLSQSQGNNQAAAEGYKQFLPGGEGGKPIIADAMRNYQQKTIPSILNAFGSNSKGSSSLNQALASSGADLNSSLASMLSQYQLNASQGLGNLGTNQSSQGLGTSGFAYLQNQPSFLQQLLLASISSSGDIAKGSAAIAAL